MVEYVRMLGNSRVKTEKSKYHTIEQCNYYAKRGIRCPYCNIGSKPVHKSLIDENGDWKFKDIKELK